ncbi:hypothetical protein CA850_29855 [Micromonospora echinospora]|uniref:Uncharacterized protein n=1 Tax=Micromonospora echinospora TaxID=1877 RepID=A0A1C5AAP3_MICEC|nr:hypothetical protein [Micromonospora echinospora]OZV74784.1 hypothetical protein CA850_29855 [Micromonospora echinospora]SCF42229.1 hypothetical protein GA0070618_6630 [Micromonospora echinospora]
MSEAYFGRLRVSDIFDGDGEMRFEGVGSGGVGTYVKRAEVARLRDHLTAVLGDGPKPVAGDAGAVEVGREYRLLPGACRSGGYAALTDYFGPARVRVIRLPDADGDVFVETCDGARSVYVLPQYLAPLDPSPAPAAADVVRAARETAAEAGRLGMRNVSSLFGRFADALEGKAP